MSSIQAIQKIISEFTSRNEGSKGFKTVLNLFINYEDQDDHNKCILN